MSKKTIRICVVDTVYTLWLSLIKYGFKPTDYFIFSTGIPEDIRKQFNHYFFSKTEVKFSKKPDRVMAFNRDTITINLNHIWQILKLKFNLFIKTFNKDVTVYGHGHLKYSFPLYKWPNNAIVEDGLSNYDVNIRQPTKFKYPKIARFFGFYFKYFKEGYGTHENINTVLLTRSGCPKSIEDKVEVMDVKKLWDMKSQEEKDEILDIFQLSDVYSKFSKDSVLLITQPLSEDRRIPLDEELKIYREIIDRYPNIIIKTHPRETKNYKELFDDVNVIDVPFPIEILKFLGVKVKKIVTLYSSVAINFKDECEIEIYDGKTSSKEVNKNIRLIKEKLNS